MHLTKIEILKDYRTLREGLTFQCSEVNLLVGEQGCGKSSLLHLLRDNDSEFLQLGLSEQCQTNGVTSFYFDAERDNPRIKDPVLYTKPSGENIGIGYGAALLSRMQSHGEVLVNLTVSPIERANDCVVLLDEPEAGLSLRNQFRLVKAIKDAVGRKVQFFIATHSLILIESCPLVVSLEHGKVMSSSEFIKLNKIWLSII